MLKRYGQAAILAAIATLMGNVVWAQKPCPTFLPYDLCQNAKSCDAKGCCATGACCKEGASCCNGKKSDASCACCKDNKSECCKGGECCCKDKSDCCCSVKASNKACTCCKDNKCQCGKGDDCCCKDGKCNCKKTSVTKKSCGCPVMNKLAKSTAIIMVMPASLPLLGTCPPVAMGMMPHPPMPMGPQAMLPMPTPLPPAPPMPGMVPPMMPPHAVAMPVPPAPPCYSCPMAMPVPCPTMPDAQPRGNPQLETCLSLLGLASDLCSLGRPLSTPSVCASALELMMEMCPSTYPPLPPAYAMQAPQCIPPSPPMPPEVNVNVANSGTPIFGVGVHSNGCLTGNCVTNGQPIVVPCSVTKADTAKVRIIAVPSSTELEMNVGDDTCVRCKKMTVKLGGNEISLCRFENRVRVRGEELKATADCVRSDRKDRLILEGDVVLHYKKDGHCANLTGDHIELNLSSGAVTIKPAEKMQMRPAVHIKDVDNDLP